MGLLSSLFRAATPENPRFNLASDEAWETLVGGEPSASGVTINEEKARTYSPWWRGINLIAASVAKLPLHLYKREGEGKVRDTAHKAYYLLRHKPNPFQTAFAFRQQITAQACSGGNGYAYIERLGTGEPIALWPLDPCSTTPAYENGKKVFIVAADGRDSKLADDEVIHVHSLSADGLCGLSVVEIARDSIGGGIARRTYSQKQFKNGARPSVVLETAAKMDPTAAKTLRDDWERMHAGLDNAHRTAVLWNGLQAKALSFNNSDAQFIEQEALAIREIANFLGIPPHKLGDTAYKPNASLEQENQAFLDDSLDPWLVNWEQQCWDKLLTEEQKVNDTHLIEFLREALIRMSAKDLAAVLATALGGRPFMLPDEARAKMNLNPLGGDAAKYLNPLNMGQGGAQNAPKPDPFNKPDDGPPADDGEEESAAATAKADLVAGHGVVLGNAVARMVRRVGTHATRAAKDRRAFQAWLDTVEADHSDTVADVLGPIDAVSHLLTGDDRQGTAVAWLLPKLRESYACLLDQSTPRTLVADVEKLNAQLETELPAAACKILLGDPR